MRRNPSRRAEYRVIPGRAIRRSAAERRQSPSMEQENRMADTKRIIAPPARLRLSGHGAAPARAEVVYRPQSVRITRGVLSLLGFWALVPIVFFIPPHLPWALAAFTLGIYFGWTNWRGALVVRTLEADCPRCGNRLTVEPGTKIRMEHAVTCYECHHEPSFEMGGVPA